ncbi:COG1470 family protein [Candidatus Solincola sp.]
MLLYLHRYLDIGLKKHLFLFTLFFLLQSLSSWHYTMFCTLAAGLLLLWKAIFSRRSTEWKRIGLSTLSLIVVFPLLIPLLLPYLRTHSRLPGFERSVSETVPYSVHASDFLRVLPQSVFYGKAPGPLRTIMAFRGVALFPGFSVIILFLFGLFAFYRRVRGRTVSANEDPGDPDETMPALERDPWNGEPTPDRTRHMPLQTSKTKRDAGYFLLLTAVGLLFSFGPRFGKLSNPFYTIPYNLGILKFTRTPMRIYLLALLGIAGLAGYGAAYLLTRMAVIRKRSRLRLSVVKAFPFLLLVLLVLEMATFNIPIYRVAVGKEVPEVYRWASKQDGARFIELPSPPIAQGALTYDGWELGFMTADPVEYIDHDGLAMYYSTYHWKEIVNGRSSYFPYFYRRIYNEMTAFPSTRTVDLLAGLHVDYVIWHWEWTEEGASEELREKLLFSPGLDLERDFGDQTVFRVKEHELAEVGELELTLASPDSAPQGERLNLGLVMRNPSGKPFVMAVEEAQPFIARFEGEVDYEVRGTFRIPLYLAPGEMTSIPLQVPSTPSAGDYHLEIRLDEGVFAPRSLSSNITLRGYEELVGSGILNGKVSLTGDNNALDIPLCGGLYPVVLQVENTGQNYWMAYWDQGRVEEYPYGLVRIWVGWSQGNQWTWDQHISFLPCDLAAGQTMQVPILVRPPNHSGIYGLNLALYDEQLGQLSEMFQLKVRIGMNPGNAGP